MGVAKEWRALAQRSGAQVALLRKALERVEYETGDPDIAGCPECGSCPPGTAHSHGCGVGEALTSRAGAELSGAIACVVSAHVAAQKVLKSGQYAEVNAASKRVIAALDELAELWMNGWNA